MDKKQLQAIRNWISSCNTIEQNTPEQNRLKDLKTGWRRGKHLISAILVNEMIEVEMLNDHTLRASDMLRYSLNAVEVKLLEYTMREYFQELKNALKTATLQEIDACRDFNMIATIERLSNDDADIVLELRYHHPCYCFEVNQVRTLEQDVDGDITIKDFHAMNLFTLSESQSDAMIDRLEGVA